MVASLGSVTTDASGNTFKVVLADDFSAGYQASNWGYAYNGGTYWNGAFSWSSNDVNVRNGEMQVTDTRHSDGSWTAGGFNSMKAGQSITYGTVEFDARVEQAQGTQAAILMWPISDAWPRDGEIDILEAPKNQAMHSSHWEGTDGSHQYSSIFSSIDPSKAHHYAMTWLPNEVTIKVDGQVVARWTDAAAIPDTAMGFGAMGYVAAKGETWLGDAPDSTTPSVVTTHIDNVVMSQWTGVSAVPIEPKVDTTPITKTIGSGTDSLVLKISQDAYKVGAQYTVSVDGKQIGGTLTAGASHAAGQDDVITVKGDWTAGAHKVTVNFLNDAWDGAGGDRNLHVDGITYNGKALAAGIADLMSNGPVDFAFTEAPPAVNTTPVVKTIGSGTDSLVLKISQDAYKVGAQYTVSVDGKQIGGTLTAGASHTAGQDDVITVKGDWTAGAHKVTVNFLNDAWDGAGGDRNLHVDGIAYNGKALAAGIADLMSNGPVDFAFTEAPPAVNTTPVVKTIGSGTDSLVLKISQDAYKVGAQYTVSVDGKQIGGTLTAGASHAAGQDDVITVKGDWTAGAHKVTVNFLSDAWDGAGGDRNLHVDGIAYNGKALAAGIADLMSNGPVDFAFTEAAAPPVVVVPQPKPDIFFPAPEPAHREIDWGATTAAVTAHYEETGSWGNLDDFTVWR